MALTVGPAEAIRTFRSVTPSLSASRDIVTVTSRTTNDELSDCEVLSDDELCNGEVLSDDELSDGEVLSDDGASNYRIFTDSDERRSEVTTTKTDDEPYDGDVFESDEEADPPLPSLALPQVPPDPTVAVVKIGPTSVRVIWDAGVAAEEDGVTTETAEVHHYKLFVCQPVMPGSYPVRYAPVEYASVRPGPVPMFHDFMDLPVGQSLDFMVMPVDIYGRRGSFNIDDPTL